MRLTFIILITGFFSVILFGGCTPAGPVDVVVTEALNEILLTDEFTEEERNAVRSISVHNEEAKVWLVSGFTDEVKKINAVAEHIGKVFAETFYNTAEERDFMEAKYNVEIWIKFTDDKGTHNALVAEWYWDLQKGRVDGNNYGLAPAKDIR